MTPDHTKLEEDIRRDADITVTTTYDNGSTVTHANVNGGELYILVDQLFYDLETDGFLDRITITRKRRARRA